MAVSFSELPCLLSRDLMAVSSSELFLFRRDLAAVSFSELLCLSRKDLMAESVVLSNCFFKRDIMAET